MEALNNLSEISQRTKYALAIATGFSILCLLKSYFSGKSCNINKDLTGYTAVITGANSGIGKQTAKRLV